MIAHRVVRFAPEDDFRIQLDLPTVSSTAHVVVRFGSAAFQGWAAIVPRERAGGRSAFEPRD